MQATSRQPPVIQKQTNNFIIFKRRRKLMSNYKELVVWQKAILLVTDIYKLTKTFPNEENYGLVSQMQRAAVSIPSNIAEGNDRNSKKEFVHFLYIARGSLAELETQIIIAERLEYINQNQSTEILNNCHEIGKMINGLLIKLVK